MVHKDIEAVRNILDDFVAAVKESMEQTAEGVSAMVQESREANNPAVVRRELARQELPTPSREKVELYYHYFVWDTLRFDGKIALRVPTAELLTWLGVTILAEDRKIGSIEFDLLSTAVTNVKDWLNAMGGSADYDN